MPAGTTLRRWGDGNNDLRQKNGGEDHEVLSLLEDLIIRQLNPQTYDDWQRVGRAIEWRIGLPDDCPIPPVQRQVEDELDQYQQELTDLSDQLQAGDIDDDEFQSRLEALTVAIILLAFLRGSQIEDDVMAESALAALENGGTSAVVIDWDAIPAEAVEDLQGEIDVSTEAGAGLGAAIMAGQYEDKAASLASRLAMWATTALGMYGLGQLFRGDSDPNLIWSFGATIEHCKTCQTLNGQVHKSSEWKAFYARTSLRPQSRNLECGGFHCHCGLYETSEPVSGNFV